MATEVPSKWKHSIYARQPHFSICIPRNYAAGRRAAKYREPKSVAGGYSSERTLRAIFAPSILGLGKRCRSFEVKHACYGGTAALQSAAAIISASPVPGARALVIASDAASVAARNTYCRKEGG